LLDYIGDSRNFRPRDERILQANVPRVHAACPDRAIAADLHKTPDILIKMDWLRHRENTPIGFQHTNFAGQGMLPTRALRQ
jgi:hypothetical protein